MLTEAGVAPLLLESRSPHPAASAATFSLWEKDGAGFGLSKKGSRSSLREELSADAD